MDHRRHIRQNPCHSKQTLGNVGLRDDVDVNMEHGLVRNGAVVLEHVVVNQPLRLRHLPGERSVM